MLCWDKGAYDDFSRVGQTNSLYVPTRKMPEKEVVFLLSNLKSHNLNPTSASILYSPCQWKGLSCMVYTTQMVLRQMKRMKQAVFVPDPNVLWYLIRLKPVSYHRPTHIVLICLFQAARRPRPLYRIWGGCPRHKEWLHLNPSFRALPEKFRHEALVMLFLWLYLTC